MEIAGLDVFFFVVEHFYHDQILISWSMSITIDNARLISLWR